MQYDHWSLLLLDSIGLEYFKSVSGDPIYPGDNIDEKIVEKLRREI